jgi:hypothetical protein
MLFFRWYGPTRHRTPARNSDSVAKLIRRVHVQRRVQPESQNRFRWDANGCALGNDLRAGSGSGS